MEKSANWCVTWRPIVPTTTCKAVLLGPLLEEDFPTICATIVPIAETGRIGDSTIGQCYYIETIKRDLSFPLSSGVPPERVCQRLKKKSVEICELQFRA